MRKNRDNDLIILTETPRCKQTSVVGLHCSDYSIKLNSNNCIELVTKGGVRYSLTNLENAEWDELKTLETSHLQPQKLTNGNTYNQNLTNCKALIDKDNYNQSAVDQSYEIEINSEWMFNGDLFALRSNNIESDSSEIEETNKFESFLLTTKQFDKIRNSDNFGPAQNRKNSYNGSNCSERFSSNVTVHLSSETTQLACSINFLVKFGDRKKNIEINRSELKTGDIDTDIDIDNCSLNSKSSINCNNKPRLGDICCLQFLFNNGLNRATIQGIITRVAQPSLDGIKDCCNQEKDVSKHSIDLVVTQMTPNNLMSDEMSHFDNFFNVCQLNQSALTKENGVIWKFYNLGNILNFNENKDVKENFNGRECCYYYTNMFEKYGRHFILSLTI